MTDKLPTDDGWGFSLDLETGGTKKATAPVLCIGVVHGNFFSGEITDEFYCRINVQSQIGRGWDASTREWWAGVGELHPESMKEVLDESLPRLDIRQALVELKNWMGRVKRIRDAHVFGKGPEFDNEFIDLLCQEYEVTVPWRFRCNQSHRTLEWLHRQAMGQYPFKPYEAQTHHALEDAREEFHTSVRDIRMVLRPELLPELKPRNLNVNYYEPDYTKPPESKVIVTRNSLPEDLLSLIETEDGDHTHRIVKIGDTLHWEQQRALSEDDLAKLKVAFPDRKAPDYRKALRDSGLDLRAYYKEML